MSFTAPTSPTSLAGGTTTDYSKLKGGSYSLPLAQPTTTPYANVTGYTPPVTPAFTSGYQAPKPPTSPVTSKPVGTLEVAHPTGTGGYTTGTPDAPSSFAINTDNLKSTAVTSRIGTTDISNQNNDYLKYAQKLAEAQGYSPDYLNAYNQSKTLDVQMAQLRGNLATGQVPGDTQGYAETFTNRALMGAGAEKAFADVSLAAQELMRQGNIAGAKALVEAYSPQSVSPGSSLVSPANGGVVYGGMSGYQDVQNRQTYANFQQNYADASVPPYNEALTSSQNLQIAQQAVAQSPSFQSKYTNVQQLAGGQMIAYNKNSGQYEVIQSASEASSQNAAASVIKDLTSQRANIQAAITTADANFPLLIKAAKDAGVNNSVPLVNSLQQKFGNNFSTSPAYATLQTLIPSLQAEYSRILSRGGTSTTVDQRQTAEALIKGTYSLNQLKAVYTTVKQESENVIAGYDKEIAAQQALLNGTTSGGSIWDF